MVSHPSEEMCWRAGEGCRPSDASLMYSFIVADIKLSPTAFLREAWSGLEKSPRSADDPLCGALADVPLGSEFRR